MVVLWYNSWRRVAANEYGGMFLQQAGLHQSNLQLQSRRKRTDGFLYIPDCSDRTLRPHPCGSFHDDAPGTTLWLPVLGQSALILYRNCIRTRNCTCIFLLDHRQDKG